MTRLIQKVFQRHFESYLQTHKVPAFHRRAGWMISACRTQALGGHVQGCPNGHMQRVQYNACRHRLCEQCAGLARERWLQAERARILPCAHRHIVFTIPHQLNVLWRYNRALMAKLLFEASAETLKTLLADPRHLGAQPGMLLALHTWGRGLWLHPHIHALVSEGGCDSEGAWRLPRRRHFLPARVAMMVFRGKFSALVRAGLEAGELVVPEGQGVQRSLNLLNKLGRVRWNVRIGERYEHGQGVVNYLARYVRGGPLKSAQVRSLGAREMSFSYVPHAPEGQASTAALMRLSVPDFMDRYLTHTPTPGQHTVRRYGLYACAKASALVRMREALSGDEAPPISSTAPNAKAPALSWQAYLARFAAHAPRTHCPTCAAPIVFLGCLTRPRAPPPVPRSPSKKMH